MSYYTKVSLVEHLIANGESWNVEQKKSNILYMMRERMSVGNAKHYRLNYMNGDGVDYLKSRIALFKKFGEEFGQAIREDDDCQALELLNDQAYRPVRHRVNGADLMDANFGGHYYNCSDCDEVEHSDNISWAYDDNAICESCRDRNYRWSDYRDTYIHDDDYEEDEDAEAGIGEYHSTDIGHIPTEFDKRANPIYLGMELEVEIVNGTRAEKAGELLNAIKCYRDENGSSEYCGLENDGSLNNGFEIVTGYTGLDVHAKQLQFFKRAWHGMRSHDTDTCGLHVHICKTGMTLYHASKMVLFINDPANQRMIESLARRDESSYAKFKDKKGSLDWVRHAKKSRDPLQNLNTDRYEALNFQNSNTVEFRLFKGTLKYSTIMACLEFTYATWFFSRDTSANELTSEKFIEFISRAENRPDTAFLRSYLASKGFSLPKQGIVKANPRLELQAA